MSKSEKRKASKMLSFRLTPDEYDQLLAVAAVAGVGIPTFVRRAACQASSLPAPSYEGRTPDKMAADYSRLLGAIGKIGNNLNQMTKIANATKSAPAVKDLKLVFAEIRALRIELIDLAKSKGGTK